MCVLGWLDTYGTRGYETTFHRGRLPAHEEAGILRAEDRVELIDGEFIAMMTIGPRHHATVDRANRALVMKAGESAIVRVQGSVRLDLYNAPEPDLALLGPRDDVYASRHAAPSDVLLVIEVAESSIDYDRTVKARLYARVNVKEYWLVDLNKSVVTCYSSPEHGTYRIVRRFRRGQSLHHDFSRPLSCRSMS